MTSVTGAQAIVDTLKEYGTELVVGYIGHSTHEVAHAVSKSGLRTINPATELGGAYMVTAYNYLKGAPCAVGIWHTAGSLLLPPALLEATSSRIPGVHIGLNSDSRMTNRDGIQQIPLGVFESVTRYAARVERIDKIGDVIHKAFQAAQGFPAGATFVDIPYDLTADRSQLQTPKGWKSPHLRMSPSAEDVAETTRLISEAKRPVIIVGGGAVQSGAGEEVRLLAELLNIPIVTTTVSQGVVSEKHPLSLGTAGMAGTTAANDVLAAADFALVLGSRLADWGISQGFTTLLPEVFVQVDLDLQRLGDVYFPTLPIVADVRDFTVALRAAFTDDAAAHIHTANQPHVEVAAAKKAEWRDFVDGQGLDDQFPLNPWRIMGELRTAMGEDDIIVSDIGNHASWALQGTVLTKPRKIMMSFGEAVLGSAVPMGIGAKLAEPNSKVFIATGDGAVQYHLNELRVAVEHDAPVVIVVFNNEQYDANEKMMTGKFGSGSWTQFTNPDYVMITKAYGGDGERIERAEDLAAALKRGAASDKPYLIDVPISVDVSLVDNHVTGPIWLMDGRDIPADTTGTRTAGQTR